MSIIESDKKKINYVKTPKSLEITIEHKIEKKKLNMIGVWLVLWTICGVVVMASLAMPFPKETRLMMFVFLTFWGYFEASVFKAYKWKRAGVEKLIWSGDTVEVIRNDGKENKVTVQTEKIRSVFLAPDNKFRTAMNDSFWNIGEPAVYIKTGARNIGFGRQLSREEAVKIEKLLKPLEKQS
jgi:hypothetical protein